MNIFWLLQGDGPFFGKWQVGSGGCFLAGGGWLLIYFGWWWVVVDVFWLVVGGGGYILDGGGWWWMVVGRGGSWWGVAQFSLTHCVNYLAIQICKRILYLS